MAVSAWACRAVSSGPSSPDNRILEPGFQLSSQHVQEHLLATTFLNISQSFKCASLASTSLMHRIVWKQFRYPSSRLCLQRRVREGKQSRCGCSVAGSGLGSCAPEKMFHFLPHGLAPPSCGARRLAVAPSAPGSSCSTRCSHPPPPSPTAPPPPSPSVLSVFILRRLLPFRPFLHVKRSCPPNLLKLTARISLSHLQFRSVCSSQRSRVP